MTAPLPPEAVTAAEKLPEKAVTLAAIALHDSECPDRTCSGPARPGVFYGRARIALGAGQDAIRADERRRVYDELGHEHYVVFTGDGWTTEHSIECRLSGHMHECGVHSAVGRWIARARVPESGRWRVADWTGDDRDEPVLECTEAGEAP